MPGFTVTDRDAAFTVRYRACDAYKASLVSRVRSQTLSGVATRASPRGEPFVSTRGFEGHMPTRSDSQRSLGAVKGASHPVDMNWRGEARAAASTLGMV